MGGFKHVEGLLDFAIHEEEKAARLYLGLAERAGSDDSRLTYEEIAREEQKHEVLLRGYRERGEFPTKATATVDLGVPVKKVSSAKAPELDYPEILLFAIRGEHEAKLMYEMLADLATDDRLREALANLAAEEARHQFRLEAEYMAAVEAGPAQE